MPVSKNTVNKSNMGRAGRDLDDTVSEQALDFDLKNVLDAQLNQHVNDPVDAHDALAISVADVAGHWIEDDVEGVLAEIGSGATLTHQQGILSGGQVTITVTGTPSVTFTLGTTVVLLGTSGATVSGTVSIPLNTANIWVYIDSSDATLKVSTSAVPPTLSSGDITLWYLVTNATTHTTSEDLRYFVPRVDRKLPLTVREHATTPSSSDEMAEGQFASIGAALNHIKHFGNADLKREILIRGPNSISSTLTIPTDSLTFRGDSHDARIILTSSGDLFDLDNNDDIAFESLVFACNAVTSKGIVDDSGVARLRVVDCSFESGTQDWSQCVDLSGSTVHVNCRFENCRFEASGTALVIDRPLSPELLQCVFVERGSSGSIGLSIGDAGEPLQTNEGRALVSGGYIQGFDTGLYLKAHDSKVDSLLVEGDTTDTTGISVVGGDNSRLSGCTVKGYTTGIQVLSAATECMISDATVTGSVDGVVLAGSKSKITNSTIEPDSTAGLDGVKLQATGCRVLNSHITCSRTVWVTQDPSGIITSSSDNTIMGCELVGWANSSANLGQGVRIANGASRTLVSGCVIHTGEYGVHTETGVTHSDVVIRDTTFRALTNSAVYAERATDLHVKGCRISSAGITNMIHIARSTSVSVAGCSFSGQPTSTSSTAIKVDGTAATCRSIRISGNEIYQLAVSGIDVEGAVTDIRISDNTVDCHIANATDVTADGVLVACDSSFSVRGVKVDNNRVQRCRRGIVLRGHPSNTLFDGSVTGNVIRNCAMAHVSGELLVNFGSAGIACDEVQHLHIADNSIFNIGNLQNLDGTSYQPSGADVNGLGIISLNSTHVGIMNNHIHTSATKGTGVGDLIQVFHWNKAASGTGHHKVCGNRLHDGEKGVYFLIGPGTVAASTATMVDYGISGNDVHDCTDRPIYFYVDGTAGNACGATAISITGNKIDSTAADLIEVFADNFGIVGNVQVSENQLTSLTATAYNGVYGHSHVDSATFNHWHITGNRISGSSNAGVAILLDPAGSDLTVANVTGNTITGYDYGVRLSAGGGDIKGATVADNVIYDLTSGVGIELDASITLSDSSIHGNTVDGGGTRPNVSVWLENDSISGALSNVSITNNTLRDATTALIYMAPKNLDRCTIAGNRLNGEAAATSLDGIRITANASSTPDIRNTVISGNQLSVCKGHGMHLTVDDVGITGLRITDNQLLSVADGATTKAGIYVETASTTALDEIVIDRNTFKDCGASSSTTATVRLEGTAAAGDVDLQRLRVCDNILENCKGDGIHLSTSYTNLWHNLRVDTNTIHDQEGRGIRMVAVGDSVANYTARNLSVSGNLIDGSGSDGILVDVQESSLEDSIALSRNQVFGAGNYGINYEAGTNGLHTIAIDNNIVADCTNTGIFFSLFDLSSTNAFIDSLSVRGNHAKKNGNHGIHIRFSTDSSNDPVNSIVIDGNQTHENGNAGTDYGIYLVLRGQTEQLVFTNNTALANFGEGFRIWSGVANSTDGGAHGGSGGALTGSTAGTIHAAVITGCVCRDNNSTIDSYNVTIDGTNIGSMGGVATAIVDSASAPPGTGDWPGELSGTSIEHDWNTTDTGYESVA